MVNLFIQPSGLLQKVKSFWVNSNSSLQVVDPLTQPRPVDALIKFIQTYNSKHTNLCALLVAKLYEIYSMKNEISNERSNWFKLNSEHTSLLVAKWNLHVNESSICHHRRYKQSSLIKSMFGKKMNVWSQSQNHSKKIIFVRKWQWRCWRVFGFMEFQDSPLHHHKYLMW